MGMNVSMKNDYSTLFNSLGTSRNSGQVMGVSNLAGLVSDYNTIKNGSYNKLVKAYYKKMGDDTKPSSSSGKVNAEDIWDSDKVSSKTASAKDYTKISSNAQSLKKATGALSEDAKTDVYEAAKTDHSQIESAVKAFADSYNALIDSAGASSSGVVNSRATSLTSLSISYGKKLASVGLNIQENGRLSVDKDKLATANADTVKSLFAGNNSYGDKVDSYASLIESGAASAASNTSTYGANGRSSYDFNSMWGASI